MARTKGSSRALKSVHWSKIFNVVKPVLQDLHDFSGLTCKSLPTHSRLAQQFPNLRRGNWNVDVPDTQMPERVNHCVDYGRRRTYCCRLSHTFSSKRVMWRGRPYSYKPRGNLLVRLSGETGLSLQEVYKKLLEEREFLINNNY